MKIVVVLPVVPHPFGDTVARWYYVLLRSLIDDGHQVVALVGTEESAERIAQARELFRPAGGRGGIELQVFPSGAHGSSIIRKIRSFFKPFREMLDASGLAGALDRELASGYDILHLEQLWTGWLGLDRPRCLLNIDHLDVIDWGKRKDLSMRERKTLFQMTRATQRIIAHTTNIRLFTPRLRERAIASHPSARYWVVPLAIDPQLYSLQPMVVDPVVGLFGSMHWYPSRSAALRLIERIWPMISKRMPNARLLIAGWNARKYLGHLNLNPDIELAENLPAPTDFFSRAAVMVYAPSRGSGMKIKILESMAYGVPVVTTSEGVEGIDYVNGVHCAVEETDSALAERTIELLESADKRNRMRRSARDLVDSQYSPQPVMRQLYAVYEEILGNHPR